MSQLFVVHPSHPQPRLMKQAAQLLQEGAILAVPTDSSYALVARLDDRRAAEALRKLRGLDDRHHLTLLCRDLAAISQFARVDNAQFRLLKLATPGPWTFILDASREVPRRVSHPSRKTIGVRVPNHPVTLALLEYADGPLLSTTLIPEGEEYPLNDPAEIRECYEHRLAGVIDAGACALEPTTVIDLTGDAPQIVRLGLGDPALLGLSHGSRV
jgi:tRNA threonylcarbamoyl adenosine modification protein (Sua5/YciO/YrdC/YwlC family)